MQGRIEILIAMKYIYLLEMQHLQNSLLNIPLFQMKHWTLKILFGRYSLIWKSSGNVINNWRTSIKCHLHWCYMYADCDVTGTTYKSSVYMLAFRSLKTRKDKRLLRSLYTWIGNDQMELDWSTLHNLSI